MKTVTVEGVEIGRGSRVVLRPRAGGDIMDVALNGKVGVVERVEEDFEGHVHLAVVIEGDPGRDMGEARLPGHRFFFVPEDVEPMAGPPPPRTRVLVAGIGNVFLADDGFGVEVATLLTREELPAGVEVRDFGIRGLALAYELQEGWDAVVLVDAVPRGGEPGTLYVIEPDIEDGQMTAMDAHGMDPVKVLGLARSLGSLPPRILVVGCEPEVQMTGEEEDIVMELSAPVRAATVEAVGLVRSVLDDLLKQDREESRS
jgi:hydrogenase maturation protease